MHISASIRISMYLFYVGEVISDVASFNFIKIIFLFSLPFSSCENYDLILVKLKLLRYLSSKCCSVVFIHIYIYPKYVRLAHYICNLVPKTSLFETASI